VLHCPDDDVSLELQTETLVFRIVQEALTNIVRHADASRARVTVARQDGRLLVTIVDNGRGFDADAILAGDKGFGLRGMRDRAELFGGELDIRSEPDEGTLIALALPETPP
jgi:two-component system sensor histidine kinase UhpB